MKPRRWYSSPEHNPNPAPPARPFPARVYWVYTTRTRREQGPIIKGEAPSVGAGRGREAGVRLRAPEPRRIDAA
ncbi:MAG TPA: hypothetical protein PKD53_11690 [Chloroflexaceae bacterium]|nr:hypothetical protein [Chloroflexaceae bacterium]